MRTIGSMRETPLERRLAIAAEVVPRVPPGGVAREVSRGAVVVDVRSQTTRARDGVIEGSVHLPLTVLHWRLDPGGAWRTPHVPEGARVLLVCDDGCSSLLAAQDLLELGVEAADMCGGITAWLESGLPLIEWDDPVLPAGALLGMEPPAVAVVRSAGWTGHTAGI